MISHENIDKFNSIISHYGLDTAQVQDAGRAVCIADILYGTNDKRLSVKRLANSGVDVFRALAQGSAQSLPDVQIMRVMCDSLYYTLLFKGKGIGRVGIHLTSEASDYIGKGIGKKQFVPANYGYCDMEECQKVLDLMYANCNEVDEPEFADIFEFTSDVLGRFRKMFDIIDKSRTLSESQFKSIYLPEKYDSHGYEVLHELPSSLRGISKGSLKEQIEFWELAKMMDLFILYLAGTKSGAIYRNAFVNRLVKINNSMQDLLPIGVGGRTGTRKDIYRPTSALNNQALNNLYDSIFSQNMALTRNSINSMFMICTRLYGIKEDI